MSKRKKEADKGSDGDDVRGVKDETYPYRPVAPDTRSDWIGSLFSSYCWHWTSGSGSPMIWLKRWESHRMGQKSFSWQG